MGVGKTWNAYRILVTKALENYLLGTLRKRKDSIKKDLREIGPMGGCDGWS
jgi:hypothetical protein